MDNPQHSLDAPKIKSNNHGELRASPETTPPGIYLLRGDCFEGKPYEAQVLEWSAGGRLKLRAVGGPSRWAEGRDIPFLVERLESWAEFQETKRRMADQ